MKQEFDAWWNDDDLTYENPFKEETPAFWAWEGWVAGVKAEREACAARLRIYSLSYSKDGTVGHTIAKCAEIILARSNE